ncbi:MAG TPA: ROK family protein [Acidimicrobiales bacterium]|nr:ROK family protein [Acidimicrobiales bacterium]
MVTDVLACVEIGGSATETVLFSPDGTVTRVDGAKRPSGARLGVATPGIVEGGRVVAASSLGWFDVDPAEALGLGLSADVVLNDAEAAALGEVALRDGVNDVVYICVGTGIGAAVVQAGRVVATNLLGHASGYSQRECLCGRVGCLETVAAGWAVPDPLGSGDLDAMAAAIVDALRREERAVPPLVVLAGGVARRYPALAERVAARAAERVVEGSAAPAGFKSAAAWGVRAALAQMHVRR